MFTNQIPDKPDFGRQAIPAAKPYLTNPIGELYPIPENGPQGWGLTFMLTSGQTGRSDGTAHWVCVTFFFMGNILITNRPDYPIFGGGVIETRA